MRQLPKHIRNALTERMEEATPRHKDGVTGEIDVDALLRVTLEDLSRDEPDIYAEFAELAPLMMAREVYQERMRTMRTVARGIAKYEAETGRNHTTDYPTSNWTQIAESGSNMFDASLEDFRQRMRPEVLSAQWSYQSGGRWHRREYGDLTSPDLGTLVDKYEAEARAKQATADSLRADKDIFEQLQQRYFDGPMPSMTIRDFFGNPAVRSERGVA